MYYRSDNKILEALLPHEMLTYFDNHYKSRNNAEISEHGFFPETSQEVPPIVIAPRMLPECAKRQIRIRFACRADYLKMISMPTKRQINRINSPNFMPFGYAFQGQSVTLIIENVKTGKLVGSAHVVLEARLLVKNLGIVASERGKGLAKILLGHIISIADKLNAPVILQDLSSPLMPFIYEQKEIEQNDKIPLIINKAIQSGHAAYDFDQNGKIVNIKFAQSFYYARQEYVDYLISSRKEQSRNKKSESYAITQNLYYIMSNSEDISFIESIVTDSLKYNAPYYKSIYKKLGFESYLGYRSYDENWLILKDPKHALKQFFKDEIESVAQCDDVLSHMKFKSTRASYLEYRNRSNSLQSLKSTMIPQEESKKRVRITDGLEPTTKKSSYLLF